MIDLLTDRFGIPKESLINKTIFKKLFYENGNLNKSEVGVFTNNIKKITLLFSLNEGSINIKSYRDDIREYEELAIIQIDINDKTKSNRVGEIVQRTIPYPIIIIFNNEDEIQLNLASKTINKADTSKNTIEEIIRSHWIDRRNLNPIEEDFIESLNLKELSFSNFYAFYMDIFNRVFLLKVAQYTGGYKILLSEDLDRIKGIERSIYEKEKKLNSLRREIRREDNFSRKLKLNIKIKTLEEDLNNLIKGLLN